MSNEKIKSKVFYGKGLIYDPESHAIIARFDRSGRLRTANPKLISRLERDGFTTTPPTIKRAVKVPGSKKMRIMKGAILFPEEPPVDADKQSPVGVGGRRAKRRADEKLRKTGFAGPTQDSKGERKKKRVG